MDKRSPRRIPTRPKPAKREAPARSAYGGPGGRKACANAECRLRSAGCRGFEGCPGYKSRE